MRKKIIFFLLIIATALHGMEIVVRQEKKDRNHILGEITKWLYIGSHFRKQESGEKEYCGWHDESVIRSFGRDIQALTCVNRFFAEELSREKSAKKLIKKIVQHRKMCDEQVAYHLNPKGGVFRTIVKEMDRLIDIVTDADKQFTQEDLKDAWYINASHQVSHSWLSRKLAKYKDTDTNRSKERTMRIKHMVEKWSPHTLLSLACKTMDFEKIKQLLAAGADCKKSINNALLLKIAKNRSTPFGKHHNRKVHYFVMAQLLLEHGADPNYPYSSEQPTPLMIAAHNNDQEYAFLLLRYFADPYCTTTARIERMEYPFCWAEPDSIAKTAYDVEQGEPKGWLKEMVETFEKQRSFVFKYWFLKNYEIDFYGRIQNIPSEIVRLIMHDLCESYGKQL